MAAHQRLHTAAQSQQENSPASRFQDNGTIFDMGSPQYKAEIFLDSLFLTWGGRIPLNLQWAQYLCKSRPLLNLSPFGPAAGQSVSLHLS